jgi:L-alanine-DL-glutamate epimerase-like enolase superfamily enzyme
MSISRVRVSAFEIPTSSPESDGTLAWNATTLVTVEVTADDVTGIGYTYADLSTAHFIRSHLAKIVLATEPMSISATFQAMQIAIRNLGRSGISAMAISAVDSACWDLKAKLLEVPLVDLLGALRPKVSAYASGGFTSYGLEHLREQLESWAKQGFSRIKMKIGNDASTVDRVRTARAAIGKDSELFVDANGAYSTKAALGIAEEISDLGVTWFEEPVSSDRLDDLRFVRERAPAAMDVAAGEYGFTTDYFERMLEARSVDVLQADATRCGGITGFIRAAALCEARGIRLSAHCAPTLHTHVCCAAPNVVHVEYFHDHQRIEHMLFDGATTAKDGMLAPDRSRAGMGFELKRKEAEKYLKFDEICGADDFGKTSR